MEIAILGTGAVGRTLASKISSLGHSVTMGTRDVEALMQSQQASRQAGETFAAWHAKYPDVKVGTFAEAASAGELIFNATSGAGCLPALELAGADRIGTKILIDIANPLDYSKGFPPSLSVVNTDSLGEQVQKALPAARVVKALNTMGAEVMIDPMSVGGGEHHLFLSGNDAGAKAEVARLLKEWFGWRHVIDLGDITTARGTEMFLALWIRLMPIVGRRFNIQVVT